MRKPVLGNPFVLFFELQIQYLAAARRNPSRTKSPPSTIHSTISPISFLDLDGTVTHVAAVLLVVAVLTSAASVIATGDLSLRGLGSSGWSSSRNGGGSGSADLGCQGGRRRSSGRRRRLLLLRVVTAAGRVVAKDVGLGLYIMRNLRLANCNAIGEKKKKKMEKKRRCIPFM